MGWIITLVILVALVCLPLGLAVLTLILLRFGKHPVARQPESTKTNEI